MSRSVMRPIRVLFLLNDASGGASMSALQLMRSFPPDQVVPFAVTALNYNDEDWARFATVCEATKNVRAQWWNLDDKRSLPIRWLAFGNAMRHNRLFTRPVRALLRLIREWNIDVVHTNTLMNLDGAIAARIAGIHHVWHIREYMGEGTHFRFPVTHGWLERIVYGLSDRVIFNSTATMAPFHGERVPDKARLIFNAIDPAPFAYPDAASRGRALRRTLGVGDDEVLVGMVGGFRAPVKRHDLFLEMAATLRAGRQDSRFAIFGAMPAVGERAYPYAQQMLARMDTLGIRDAILTPGYQDDIAAMMHAIDIMAHPTLEESFGRVLIEAMAAAKPVVAYRSGGPIDVIDDGVTGRLIDPANTAEMAHAVETLIDDPNLRERFGMAGQRRVHDRFSLGGLAAAIQTQYRDILSSHERRSTLESRRPRQTGS